jgi:hypothetical protein
MIVPPLPRDGRALIADGSPGNHMSDPWRTLNKA